MEWSLEFSLEWSLESLLESFLESILECFFILNYFKNAFCLIYKNSDYNLLPVDGIN
jgi:hypothetical protein